MKIVGIKLTHDGAVCLIEDDKLIFNIELEKLNNNPRYEMIEETSIIKQILADHGYSISEIDHFAVDGWGGYSEEELAVQPRLRIGKDHNYLAAESNGVPFELSVAQYQERNLQSDITLGLDFDGLAIGGATLPYTSYLHVTGHVLSAYCTSPFARKKEDSYVLVWDGGMFPNLYHVSGGDGKIVSHGPIFLLIGNIYTIFSQHFGPFKVNGRFAKDNLSIAGKVMAYIAKGECRAELFPVFNSILEKGFENIMGYANEFANDFKKALAERNLQISDEDILRTFHEFLGELLVSKLTKKVKRIGRSTTNLCLAGGCALNIKWNSSVRQSGLFSRVYVPPFPNDSGSAVGAACAKRFEITQCLSLEWDVYSGPQVIKNAPAEGWLSRACDVAELAKVLHETGEPVVFLNGKAELGPRALGNRSILAPANSTKVKKVLNAIKNREEYRPVSPICLESHAGEVFFPGNSDQFMLFDHQVKPDWLERIPGIVHLDNSARLQTVNQQQNGVIFQLLVEYHRLSEIPLLCNTSANFNGTGFFPDIYSATNWNKTRFVWCDNTLFFK